jgi:hypothetical protein
MISNAGDKRFLEVMVLIKSSRALQEEGALCPVKQLALLQGLFGLLNGKKDPASRLLVPDELPKKEGEPSSARANG